MSVAKSVRSFIFVTIAISVPYFLSNIGVSSLDISLVILASIAISTMFLYIHTALDINTRMKMILLSVLFTGGLGLLYFWHNLMALILSITVGSISLGGRDFATNQSIEQYTISTYSENQAEKNHMFSVYNFASYGSGAMASLFLYTVNSGNYQLIFLLIFLLSFVQIAIYLAIKFPEIRYDRRRKFIGSQKTRSTVRNLAVLFSLDSLGGGLVNTSIISLWFKSVYGITLSQAGLLFVLVNIITALSVILSGYISSSLGLVRTMVYTHLISNIMLFLVPVFHVFALSKVFLLLRQCTSQMDVPARDSFVNTVIPLEYRVSTNSTFLAVRNGFQIPGPGIAGFLLESFPGGVFYLASTIKIAYDLAFFTGFRHHRI